MIEKTTDRIKITKITIELKNRGYTITSREVGGRRIFEAVSGGRKTGLFVFVGILNKKYEAPCWPLLRMWGRFCSKAYQQHSVGQKQKEGHSIGQLAKRISRTFCRQD